MHLSNNYKYQMLFRIVYYQLIVQKILHGQLEDYPDTDIFGMKVENKIWSHSAARNGGG